MRVARLCGGEAAEHDRVDRRPSRTVASMAKTASAIIGM